MAKFIELKDLKDNHQKMAIRYLFAKYGHNAETQKFLNKLKDGKISDLDAQDYLRDLERKA